MGIVHRLEYGSTGNVITLVPTPRETSATWEIHDLRYPASSAEYVVASGSSSVDTAAEVLTGDAGPGQPNARRLRMASTTGFTVGRACLLSDAQGSEVVVVEGLTANASLTTEAPIIGQYLVDRGAAVAGVELRATVPDAVAADEERMRFHDALRIVWTLASGARCQAQIRVVREGGGDTNLAAALRDLQTLFPDVGTRVQHHGKNTLPGHAATFARQLDAMERQRGDDPALALRGEGRHWALVWGTLRHLAALGIVPGGNQDSPTSWRDHCHEQFVLFWEGATKGEPGTDSVRLVRETGEATGNRDLVYRSTIQGL